MKRLFVALTILATMAACSSAVLPAPVKPVVVNGTGVRFDLPATPVAAGSVFAVKVQLDNVSGLAGDEVRISYNPAILEVQDSDPSQTGVQVKLESFLKPDFVAQNLVESDEGRVSFAAVQLPPNRPVSGSGVLATIAFKAKTGGSSPLTFDTVLLSGENGTSIKYTVQNSQVVVSPK
jgi:hypothetical protein